MIYKMTYKWNPPAACWTIDLADEDGTPILSGFSMVTGADLLEQFAYLGFSGQLIAQTDGEPDAVPTFENLGTGGGRLFFMSP